MRWFPNPFAAFTYLRERRSAYSRIPAQVIADLAEFTRAYASCFDKDPLMMARLEGRRDVWLHIRKHSTLTDDELYQQATGGAAPPAPAEDELPVRVTEYVTS